MNERGYIVLFALKSQNVSMRKLNNFQKNNIVIIIIVIVVVVIIIIKYLLIMTKIINIPSKLPPPPPPPNLFFMCLETPNFITQRKSNVIAACNVLISHVK